MAVVVSRIIVLSETEDENFDAIHRPDADLVTTALITVVYVVKVSFINLNDN